LTEPIDADPIIYFFVVALIFEPFFWLELFSRTQSFSKSDAFTRF